MHFNPDERDRRRIFFHEHRGLVLDVEFTIHRDRRNEKANRYYRAKVVDEIARETEHTPDEVHDAMCEMFLPSLKKQIAFFNVMTGQKLEIITDGRRSSGLDGYDFYDFVERVRQWAREFLGVYTEDPDPEYWKKRIQTMTPSATGEIIDVTPERKRLTA